MRITVAPSAPCCRGPLRRRWVSMCPEQRTQASVTRRPRNGRDGTGRKVHRTRLLSYAATLKVNQHYREIRNIYNELAIVFIFPLATIHKPPTQLSWGFFLVTIANACVKLRHQAKSCGPRRSAHRGLYRGYSLGFPPFPEPPGAT